MSYNAIESLRGIVSLKKTQILPRNSLSMDAESETEDEGF